MQLTTRKEKEIMNVMKYLIMSSILFLNFHLNIVTNGLKKCLSP